MGFWSRLQTSLKQRAPHHIASAKRASVAAVFRHSSDAKLQLLFIRRCVNPRDTWSGQIAFPGGRTQANETDIDSARRETMEEIGLDLHDPSVQVLGQLNDRPVHYGTTVVSSFVFYTPSTEFTPTLEPSEVQDALWVDVDYLLHAPIQSLPIPVEMIFPRLKSYPLLHKFLHSHSYLSHFRFPCIYLPRPNSSSRITSQDTLRKSNDFVLWGLTYTMMSDLLVAGGSRPLPMTSPSLRLVRNALFHWRSSMESSDSEIVDIGVLSDGSREIRWDKAGVRPLGETRKSPWGDVCVTSIEIELEKLTCKSPAYVETWRHEFGAEIDRLQQKLMELRNEVDRRRRDMQFEDWYIQRTLTTGDIKEPMFASYIRTLQEKYAGNVQEFEVFKAKLRREEKKVELFCGTAFNDLPLLARRYQLKTIIGHGGNSVVWEAYDIDTQQFVAIKISNKIHHAEQEYHNHEMFRGSDHTVRLHAPLIYIKHQCNPYALMIMDRMECDLNQFMENRKAPCELALARHILFELLLGLHYLHEKNMAHCDLKPANILLTSVASAQARLTDFHLSRPKSSTIIVGQNASPAFAPPEWYLLSPTEAHTEGATYEKFDIWAVGLIFYILLCNQHPLGTQSSKVDMTDRMMEYRNHPRICFPSYIPTDVQELLKQCLHIDWHCRPTTKQLLAIVCYK